MTILPIGRTAGVPTVASNAKKMTPELIDYIIIYYSNLFTDKEKAAYNHHNTLLKHEDSESRVGDAMLKHWELMIKRP